MARPDTWHQILLTLLTAAVMAAALVLAASARAADLTMPELPEVAAQALDGGAVAPISAPAPGAAIPAVAAPAPEETVTAPPQAPAEPEAPSPPTPEASPRAEPDVSPPPEPATSPPQAPAVPQPPEPAPRTLDDGLRSGASAAQNVNLEIRILSPGDNGPVNQDVLMLGGPAPTGSIPIGDTPNGLDWTWNWTWSESCGEQATAAASWDWNWTWCGDLPLPGLTGPVAKDPSSSRPGSVSPRPAPAPAAPVQDRHVLDAPGRASAGRASTPTRAPRSGVGGEQSLDRSPAAWRTPASVRATAGGSSGARMQPAGPSPAGRGFRIPSIPALQIAAGAATAAGPEGASGAAITLVLLAALLLIGPSLLRVLVLREDRRTTSVPNSRLERPG
jgi:hypothetical protein